MYPVGSTDRAAVADYLTRRDGEESASDYFQCNYLKCGHVVKGVRRDRFKVSANESATKNS